jgi:hypothetical protein
MDQRKVEILEGTKLKKELVFFLDAEFLPLVPLIGLVFFIGMYPKPILEPIEPSVQLLVEHIERQVPGFESPGTQDGSDLQPVASGAGSGSSPEGGE